MRPRPCRVVLTRTAEAAAGNTGFVQRRSKLTGPAFVQTLTFGWLSNPEATLEDLAQTANTVGVSISPQGLDQRFTPQAAACLLEVLQAAVARVLTADPVAIPLLQRFPGGVMVLDSTTVSLPDALACQWPSCTSETAANGTASLKLHVRLDLLHGTLHGPVVVQHWVLLVSCWSYANRSLAKGAGTVRRHALHLAAIVGHRQLVCKTLEIIQRCLKQGCRIDRRLKEPPTFQLLLQLTEGG